MNLSELTENSGKQLVIIYPGRFHPFHIGHGKVYKYLKQKYSNAKVFISTSGKVDGDRSPFTFDEKKKMMMLAGVDGSAIVQTKSPYQSVEIMERFDQNTTVMVFAVSEKDMAEDPRFDFSGGIKLKKNGEPAYLQKWNGLEDAETFGTRGYIATTPTFPFEVLGQKINSASQIRNMIVNSDDTKLTQMLQDLYNITDVPQDVIELFKTKIGNKDAMNENWDEDSFSKFLTENVIEENTMKRNILQAISEGKSPHKKGTKKYNAHMAAMHAESIDEEFDKKVEEVMELKKTNEWVQDSPAQGFSGQERNFIQELCLRMDGVSKSPEGLKWMGKSKTWDEGNVLSDKGKLTTVMLWAKRNIDDLYDKMGSEFKVYSDGNDIIGRSGRGQSDGNQIMQNIINKIGTVNENWKDVTPAGYGPDDYDEKDVAPEAHDGDLKKMQDSYKHNEDRNNHSENILMLAQAFGDRGEIKAVEGLLKIIKRQGYTTPEQSDMMYKAIHKKYYKQLFPETEAEGNKFSGELKKAKIDGKKSFDVDGKTYKVKEALSKLLDKQKI